MKKRIPEDAEGHSHLTAETLFPTKLEILFQAVRLGDVNTILDLYEKRMKLHTVNEHDGNTALHIASMNGNVLICRLLIVFSTPIKLWKIRNKRGLIAEDLACNERIKEDLQMIGEKYAPYDDVSMKENLRILNSIKSWPSSAKVLLSLDGGGIKVLALLQVLIFLDSYISGGFLSKIDMIAGTSCGGITALLIGQDHLPENMRRHFFEMRNEVFCGNKEKFPKHSSEGFEKTSKAIFGKKSKMSSLSKRVFVTVADTLTTPPNLVLFRSYLPRIPKEICRQNKFLDPSRILLWKAARCTSAAPYFFESFNGLSDGGLVANNPTLAMMTEFFNILKLETHYSDINEEKEKIGLVISIGTGIGPPEKTKGIDLNLKNLDKKNPIRLARGLMNVVTTAKTAFHLLIKEVTSSQGMPVKTARAWCHSLSIPYFRFNPMLNSDVPLDCTNVEKIVNMMWETELYLRSTAIHEFKHLAELLRMKTN
ncbi:unnamed protein product [Auanema sp. JU1783]|nr:unnamed protein product [Auanema sp. JU1783]